MLSLSYSTDHSFSLSKCEGVYREHIYLKGLSEECPLLSFGPLNALQTQFNLLSCGCLHIQEKIQQRAHQSGRLCLAYRDQERSHKLQEPTKLWTDKIIVIKEEILMLPGCTHLTMH